MHLERLVGNDVELRSQGGDIVLGVCYGDNVLLNSGGGPVSIKQMNSPGVHGCQRIVSNGGNICVGGVDGSAILDSASGNIDLQVLAG